MKNPIIRNYKSAPPKVKKEVLNRDDYTCQKCGFKGYRDKKLSFVTVHHKMPYRVGGEHVLDNLETLCEDCHREADREWNKLCHDWHEEEKRTRVYDSNQELVDHFMRWLEDDEQNNDLHPSSENIIEWARTEIYLTVQQKNQLKVWAKLRGKKIAVLIREAIDNYLKTELGETSET